MATKVIGSGGAGRLRVGGTPGAGRFVCRKVAGGAWQVELQPANSSASGTDLPQTVDTPLSSFYGVTAYWFSDPSKGDIWSPAAASQSSSTVAVTGWASTYWATSLNQDYSVAPIVSDGSLGSALGWYTDAHTFSLPEDPTRRGFAVLTRDPLVELVNGAFIFINSSTRSYVLGI